MNLIDQLRAARVYDLAQPLEPSTPVSPNHPPYRHALLRRHGDSVREDGSSGANDLITLGGHTGTHIDALCHVALDGRLHGGVDAVEAARGGRFSVLGVETIAPILCRGVLLDVPRALGVDALDAAHAVGAEDLARACRVQSVDVGPGDAVLIRTGWPSRHFTNADAFIGAASGVPGPDVTAARWLAEGGVRITGADTIAYEWLAPGAGHSRLPVHVILLVQHGIHIIEVLNLEELAADRVYEFALVAVPLPLVGATGSPMRPLALVS
jgi:kynurenine formamidase